MSWRSWRISRGHVDRWPRCSKKWRSGRGTLLPLRRAAEERKRASRKKRAGSRSRGRRNEGRARPDFKGREAHGLSRDELLQIFGFPPGASPELGALRRAFIREANKTHPVPGQPDYRERNDRYRVLKDAYERLKIAFG